MVAIVIINGSNCGSFSVFLLFFWWFGRNFVLLQRQIEDIMSYTKEPLVISNPSEKLLKAIEELRRNKLAKLEKLRNMKPEEFNRRVILA